MRAADPCAEPDPQATSPVQHVNHGDLGALGMHAARDEAENSLSRQCCLIRDPAKNLGLAFRSGTRLQQSQNTAN
jgi:hypothetical protein